MDSAGQNSDADKGVLLASVPQASVGGVTLGPALLTKYSSIPEDHVKVLVMMADAGSKGRPKSVVLQVIFAMCDQYLDGKIVVLEEGDEYKVYER